MAVLFTYLLQPRGLGKIRITEFKVKKKSLIITKTILFCVVYRTPSNLLVVNLAFSDFLMMFTMAPPMVINCYYETWVFGRKYLIHLVSIKNTRSFMFNCIK